MCHVVLPLVSIYGLFPVLVSCHYELSMFQLCLSRYVLITLCILVLSFEFDLIWSTRYSPVFLSMSALFVKIKDYYLSLSPRLRVPVPPSCVHRDRRPDLTVSGAPSPCFVFSFWKFLFCSCLCLSRGKEVAARNPTIAHCKTAWEFSGIAASPLAASPHARRSREISAAGGGSPKPAGGLPSSRVAAPPGAPFAGDHATGPPLTHARRIAADSCPPDRRWLMPAGSPLTHARRIAADSCPPDRRWLMPTGLALTHACWPPLTLAPWI